MPCVPVKPRCKPEKEYKLAAHQIGHIRRSQSSDASHHRAGAQTKAAEDGGEQLRRHDVNGHEGGGGSHSPNNGQASEDPA